MILTRTVKLVYDIDKDSKVGLTTKCVMQLTVYDIDKDREIGLNLI